VKEKIANNLSYLFTLQTKGRTFEMSAPSNDQMLQWISSLASPLSTPQALSTSRDGNGDLQKRVKESTPPPLPPSQQSGLVPNPLSPRKQLPPVPSHPLPPPPTKSSLPALPSPPPSNRAPSVPTSTSPSSMPMNVAASSNERPLRPVRKLSDSGGTPPPRPVVPLSRTTPTAQSVSSPQLLPPKQVVSASKNLQVLNSDNNLQASKPLPSSPKQGILQCNTCCSPIQGKHVKCFGNAFHSEVLFVVLQDLFSPTS